MLAAASSDPRISNLAEKRGTEIVSAVENLGILRFKDVPDRQALKQALRTWVWNSEGLFFLQDTGNAVEISWGFVEWSDLVAASDEGLFSGLFLPAHYKRKLLVKWLAENKPEGLTAKEAVALLLSLDFNHPTVISVMLASGVDWQDVQNAAAASGK